MHKSIKRLKSLSVSGHVFYGTVEAQSGLSEWNFKLNFDCRGHLSTKCKTTTENKDSTVTKAARERIRERLELYNAGERPKPKAERKQREASREPGASEKVRAAFCPYCGKQAADAESKFCGTCGKRLPLV